MSLKTLLERFTRGLPLPSASGYGEAQYYGEDEDYMVDPRHLDIAEREELMRNNKTKIYDLSEQLKKMEESAKLEAEQRAKAEEEKQKAQVYTVEPTSAAK